MSFTQNFRKFLLLIFFSLVVLNFANSESPLKDWEEHSENIIILDTDEVKNIVNSRSAILLDTWKKDIKPEKLDSKKWMPARRYSIPGAKWLPNVGLKILTPEIRKYFEESLKVITKENKDAKLVLFCRRGYYSKIASKRIVKMGYTNVFMYPGTDFWEDAGKRLVVIRAHK